MLAMKYVHIARHLKYEPIRIDVSKKHTGKIKAKSFVLNKPLPYPLALNPISYIHYFEEEKNFNIIGFILQNKMILIMVIMTIVMFGMQKLAGPEMMKELNSNVEEERLLPSFNH